MSSPVFSQELRDKTPRPDSVSGQASAVSADLFSSPEKLIKEKFGNAVWSASVIDCDSGKTIFSESPDRNMIPASTLKILVTAAALDRFGPDYRIKTSLYLHKGVLYIRGGGDPSIGSSYIKNARSMRQTFSLWLKAVKKLNIRKLKAVMADETYFDPSLPGSWGWEDVGNYYAAPPSALSAGDNIYRVVFRPGKKNGEPAAVLRTEVQGYSSVEALPMRFINEVTTASPGTGDNVYIHGLPPMWNAILRGTVPAGVSEFKVKGAVPDPALYVARSFSKYLKENKIKVLRPAGKAATPKKAVTVVVTEGSEMKDIISATNKQSFNLYAELLLRLLAAKDGRRADEYGGIAEVKKYLNGQGVDASELKITDASGLSRLNLVKAQAMAGLLCSVEKKDYFMVYRESLAGPADSDAKGHIRTFGRGYFSPDTLRIKSGSVNGVRAYTGYLVTGKGTRTAFSFMLNNYSCSPSGADSFHEDLLKYISERY